MTFFLSTEMIDYQTRNHPLVNGKRTTKTQIDAENERRAMYLLSQEFRSKIEVYSDDPHCKIDFAAKSPNGEITALFEFKKRGGKHNDPQYRRGWWVPCEKLDALVYYGIHLRKQQNKSLITDLYYCWGFNDGFYYINIQESKVWLCDYEIGGLGYSVKEKKNNGKEAVYLVPRNNPFICEIRAGSVDTPWRYASNALAA